jgi:hypothetical protein
MLTLEEEEVASSAVEHDRKKQVKSEIILSRVAIDLEQLGNEVAETRKQRKLPAV